MMDSFQAMRVQFLVLRELDPKHNTNRKTAFIDLFGEKMRQIIDTFPKETGRNPTPADIIWCLWQHINADPRVLIHELVCQELPQKDHEEQ
jgi:hypothetical protein